jgi:hypothetical protein
VTGKKNCVLSMTILMGDLSYSDPTRASAWAPAASISDQSSMVHVPSGSERLADDHGGRELDTAGVDTAIARQALPSYRSILSEGDGSITMVCLKADINTAPNAEGLWSFLRVTLCTNAFHSIVNIDRVRQPDGGIHYLLLVEGSQAANMIIEQASQALKNSGGRAWVHIPYVRRHRTTGISSTPRTQELRTKSCNAKIAELINKGNGSVRIRFPQYFGAGGGWETPKC